MWRAIAGVQQSKNAKTVKVSQRNYGTPGEDRVSTLLKDKLNVQELDVKDVSGGCGAMYNIRIVSSDFKGQSMVQQHRRVNEILETEIKQWHGLTLSTSVPK
eukprot:TRINITY_DN4382_c0_g1_i1.p1 TRINITY_DN4382_c0_g1~~TRINITY_DN4382_c0_g1_i1.p1  ORF type:complete len:102 (+),score=11.79 TRINITY_DN4382_c0_g1_i1:195-500(+)